MYINLNLYVVYISGKQFEPNGRPVIAMEGGSNLRKTGATESIFATTTESSKGR